MGAKIPTPCPPGLRKPTRIPPPPPLRISLPPDPVQDHRLALYKLREAAHRLDELKHLMPTYAAAQIPQIREAAELISRNLPDSGFF